MFHKLKSKLRSHIIVGMGISAADYLAIVDPFPGPNQKITALESARQGGGPVATAMATAAILGAETHLISVLGKDPEADFIIAELHRAGVDTRNIIIDPDVSSPTAFIWIEKRTGYRTVVLDNRNSRLPTVEEVDFSLISRANVLLIDGRGKDISLAALKTAREHNVLTIMDAGNVRNGMEEYMPLVDVLICSREFAEKYSGEKDPWEAIQSIALSFSGNVVVTLGSQGAVALTNGNLYSIPPYPVRVKDTTGAGDVFHGAFAAALAAVRKLDSSSFRMCLYFATVSAALSCRKLGGRAGICRLDEVMHHWENYTENAIP